MICVYNPEVCACLMCASRPGDSELEVAQHVHQPAGTLPLPTLLMLTKLLTAQAWRQHWTHTQLNSQSSRLQRSATSMRSQRMLATIRQALSTLARGELGSALVEWRCGREQAKERESSGQVAKLEGLVKSLSDALEAEKRKAVREIPIKRFNRSVS